MLAAKTILVLSHTDMVLQDQYKEEKNNSMNQVIDLLNASMAI